MGGVDIANERTALSYTRTAQAFSVLGVAIAQLMRLNTAGSPDLVYGYYAISVPLASGCHIVAIIITVVGAARFFHWQSTMALGHALSSGWELLLVFGLSLLVRIILFWQS